MALSQQQTLAMQELYRRGAMNPQRTAAYEEMVRRGSVNDAYAQGRLEARGNPSAGAGQVFANSVPFLSEINGGAHAALAAADDAIHGRNGPNDGFAADWNQMRAAQAGRAAEFQGSHPGATGLIKGVGLAGQVAAGLATGGAAEAPAAASVARTGLVAGAKRLAVTGTRNATVGAGVAGVNAFAQPGTLDERVQDVDKALPSGAAFGVAIPAGANAFGTVAKVAGRYGSAAYGALDRAVTGLTANQKSALLPPDVVAQGKDAALDYLTKLGVTPESLTAAQTRVGDAPITTAEAIGPQGVSQATALARRPGTTPQVAADTMATRGGDRTQRILGHIQDTTGIDPTSARGSVDAVVANGQATAKPLYDAALSSGAPVWNDDLAAIAQRPVIKDAIRSASTDMLNGGKDPTALQWIMDRVTSPREVLPGRSIASPPTTTETATPAQYPTAETWDLVKKAAGSQVERHPLTNAVLPDSVSSGNHNINQATGALAGALRDAVPGYGDALDTSGDYLSVKGAYDRAQGKLFGTSGTANDPRSFDAWFQGLKPGEQSGAKASVVNDLFTKLNNGQLQPSALTSPAVQSKLTTAFGADAAQDLIGRMKIEADMSAASARMTPNTNSTTGDVVGSQQSGLGADLADAGVNAFTSAVTGNKLGVARAVGAGLASVGRVAGQDSSMATRNAFGGYLYAPPADTANALASRATTRLLSEPGGNSFIPKTISALQIVGPAAAAQDQSQ